MNFKPKKWQVIVVGVLLLFLLVNPTLKDFQEYLGSSARTSRYETPDLRRTSNFLLFSTYKCNSHNYVGVLKNFIELNSHIPEPPTDSTSIEPDAIAPSDTNNSQASGTTKLLILYDAISKEYDLGSFQEFQQKMKDPVKRRKFYNTVGVKYDLGNYEDFERKIGTSQK